MIENEKMLIGAPKETVLINENEREIRLHKQRSQQDVNELNEFMAALENLQLNISFSKEEIFNLISIEDASIEQKIRVKLIESSDTVKIGGLPLDRHRLASLIELPDLTSVFLHVEKMRSRNKSSSLECMLSDKFYTLTDGKFSVNYDLFENYLNDKFRFFLTKDESMELENAINSLDKICSKYGGDPKKQIVQFGVYNQSCSINKKFFKVH